MSQTTQTSQTKYTSSGTGKASTPGKTKSSKSDGKKKVKEMSSYHRERASWMAYIRKFKKDLQEARAVVDDKPPRLNVPLLYDTETLKMEHNYIGSFFALNPEMVKYLHRVNVHGGKTDTFAGHGNVLPRTNFNMRRNQALYIERCNKRMKRMLQETRPRLPSVQEYAKQWKKTEALMEFNSQFPLFWKVKRKRKEKIEVGPSKIYFKQYVTEKSAKYPDKRPRVFFEISIKNVGSIGKMVAVLFSDYVPMTVKNFLAFCDPKAQLTYKGCFFYLIFQNFFCQTGDVVENKGFGGTSIYGPYFGDEDHTLQHGERGILTMFNTIPNRNQCQFLITFRELKTLNGRNVVFGKIIRGFHVLEAIESVGSKMTGRPKVDIFISDCDEI